MADHIDSTRELDSFSGALYAKAVETTVTPAFEPPTAASRIETATE
jgi:hypothetical protein